MVSACLIGLITLFCITSKAKIEKMIYFDGSYYDFKFDGSIFFATISYDFSCSRLNPLLVRLMYVR